MIAEPIGVRAQLDVNNSLISTELCPSMLVSPPYVLPHKTSIPSTSPKSSKMHRSITRCTACRHNVLDAFTALAGISIQPFPQTSTSRRPIRTLTHIGHRTFSTSRPFSGSESSSTGQQLPSLDENAHIPSSLSSSQTSIPWYLQVQTPSPPAPSSRLHALEDIPPIPEDAPAILHPILTHLSTQMGLDNLTLLDLRSVYPPPALGSNLLMILGTARSYKHLNTSADRFCRWLRSKYKLAPYADGLLGRNELKLKLRRKARRMKLAQSVGNTVAMGSTEGGDDGITTGWVCVNVGSVDGVEAVDENVEEDVEEAERIVADRQMQEEVERDEEEYRNPPDDSGVIGFGTRDTKPRIVVQMFTEEKRLEMDLEGLWDIRVQRRGRKEEKIDREINIKGS